MKNYLFLSAFIFISLITVPLLTFSGENRNNSTVNEAIKANTAVTEKEKAVTEEKDSDGSVTVFLSNEKKNITISELDYILGSVAAEMPLSYHEEALKAQAVACYTNLKRLSYLKNEDLNGADITDNPNLHQGYISQEERKEKWGKDFEKYEGKLQKAVKEVLGKALFYNGKYCICAFFAISAGTTETAENVWGENVPYLVNVKSDGDTLSPSYMNTATFAKAQFISIVKDLDCNLSKNDDFEKNIKITKTSKAGYVLKIKIGEKEFSGEEIRNAFSLKSTAFKISFNNNEVVFKTSGYGHGVGLSQYGADYMARQGSNFEEILKHYYKNTEII